MLKRLLPIAFIFIIGAACNGNRNKKETITEVKKVDKQLQTFTIYEEELAIESFDDVRVTTSKFFSGKKSLYLNSEVEYSAGFKIPMSSINSYRSIDSLSIALMYNAAQKIENLKLVFSIDDGTGKSIAWNGYQLVNNKTNEWESLKIGFKINPALITQKCILYIYLWNSGKEKLWVDDFKCMLIGRHAAESNSLSINTNYYFDFEEKAQLIRSEKIKYSLAHSGKMSCDLSDGTEYGIAFKKKFSDLSSSIITKIAASVWVYPTQQHHDLVLTFSSVDKNTGEVKFWHGKSTLNGVFPLNKWTKLNSAVNIPVDKFNAEDEIEVSIWNKGKTGAFVDDLHIVYGDQPERKSIAADLETKQMHNYHNLHLDTNNIAILPEYTPGDKLIHAFYHTSSNKTESILLIGNAFARMICFNMSSGKMETIWQTKDKQHVCLNKNNLFFGGDFDADHVADLLVVHTKTRAWELFHFEKSNWISFYKSTSEFPLKWINDEAFVSVSNHLLREQKSVLVKTQTGQLSILVLINKQWQQSTYGKNHKNAALAEHDMLLDWNEGSFLKFNNNWRFELDKLCQKQQDLSLNAHIAFAGFKKNCNPKYYEYTKLISGNFISPTQKSLLMCSFNCSNKNDQESSCREVEQNIELPNVINFYHQQ